MPEDATLAQGLRHYLSWMLGQAKREALGRRNWLISLGRESRLLGVFVRAGSMDTTLDVQASNTEALNALLRSEMSAVDTYTEAMGKFNDQLVIADLQKIRDEHSRAVRELRDHVVRSGGRPSDAPRAWGMFASALEGETSEVSPATVLAALRQGEECSVCEYEAALEREMHPDCQRTIRTDLILACRNHVEELNRLLGGMKH